MPLTGRAIRHIACTVAAAALLRAPASAQDVTEAALKAAFIYNFAQFTEWPVDALPAARERPFVLCVVGDDAVGDALGRAVKERHIAGHVMCV